MVSFALCKNRGTFLEHQLSGFHLLKNICLSSPAGFKVNRFHYWKYVLFFPGVLAKWKLLGIAEVAPASWDASPGR